MKTFINISLSTVVALTCLSSCSDNKWEPGPQDASGSMTVFFEPLAKYNLEIESEANHIISIPVSRADWSQAATVPFVVGEVTQGIIVPDEVIFEAGQKTAVIEIDATAMPAKTSAVVNLAIDPNYTGLYGAGSNELALNIQFTGGWEIVGYATLWYDDWSYDYNIFPSQKNVPVYNLDGTKKFKLEKFLGSDLDFVFTSSNSDGTGYIIPLQNYWYCVDYDSTYTYGDTDFYFYNNTLEEWPYGFSPDGSQPYISYYTVYNDTHSYMSFTDDKCVINIMGEAEFDDGEYGYVCPYYSFKPLYNPFK